ncbi:dehydrogenase SagB [Amycolatopsis sp. A1MSW2902]|uniref:SagB/ThcOx family dehydrogenase n=1 Tax=Amycolatopsis sp. A1MSW2902 TaxID=687413 RepID=UPI00307E0FBB
MLSRSSSETLSLRRETFRIELTRTSFQLVSGHHAETFTELTPVETAMLRRLGTDALSGDEIPGDVSPFVDRLRRGGWLRIGVMHDDAARYVLEPLRRPPEKTPPPPGTRLSRFALLHRDGGEMIIESPLAWCDIRIIDPGVAGLVAALADSAEGDGASDVRAVLRADLWWAGLLTPQDGAERSEFSHRQWATHELWFHERSRGGHRSYTHGGFGGTRWAEREFPSPPARHEPEFAGPGIDLPVPDLATLSESDAPLTSVLEARCSIRRHDDTDPLTLGELAEFLYRAARTRSVTRYEGVEYKSRPHPSGGSVYELEIYPVVRSVEGLEPGMYHYDAEEHRLVSVTRACATTHRMLRRAAASSRQAERPQVLLVVAARFGRLMWNYEAMTYALVLKHVGVLYQTMYLIATAMGLAACGLGSGDSVLFTDATGIDPLVEGTVGEFMLGRPGRERTGATR